MIKREIAAAEMIGAIVLMAIMGTALAIVGIQWIAQIETATPPYTSLEISCGNETASPFKDFSCRTGSINCSEPIKSLTICKNQCNPYHFDEKKYQKCLDSCMQENNCADLTNHRNCNMLFICHLSGEPLSIDKISIFVNDVKKGSVNEVYNYITKSTSIADGLFENGEVIRFPLYDSDIPIKTITVTYTDIRTGNSFVIGKKIFTRS